MSSVLCGLLINTLSLLASLSQSRHVTLHPSLSLKSSYLLQRRCLLSLSLCEVVKNGSDSPLWSGAIEAVSDLNHGSASLLHFDRRKEIKGKKERKNPQGGNSTIPTQCLINNKAQPK